MRFQTTLEGVECLRRSDAGWQSVPGTLRSDEERAVILISADQIEIRLKFRLEHGSDQTLKPTTIAHTFVYIVRQKASLITQLTSDANAFRCVFVLKDDILNI